MPKFKISIPRKIIILLLASLVFGFFRVVLFDKFSLIYIFWNLFLAILPFIISSLIVFFDNSNKLTSLRFLILGFVWLLLIPNAPYLVTDLIHIGEVRSVPILYDTILIFTSALVGLEIGLASMRHIHGILLKRCGKTKSNVIVVATIFFMSFGIYLGRFLRFNSWDILARPISFLKAIGQVFTQNNLLLEASFYTVLFFVFILTFYYSWKHGQEN